MSDRDSRRKELEAELAALDADDDPEDDEIELGFDDGSYFRGSFRRAKGVASARGFKLAPEPEPEGDGGKDDGKDAVKGKGKAGGQQGGAVRAFRPRSAS